MAKADLYLDQSAFSTGKSKIDEQRELLLMLRGQIDRSFERLRKEWDSDAGKKFFERFQSDLLDNLDKYAIVFGYISENLSTSSQKYEEVFRAADAVASAQY